MAHLIASLKDYFELDEINIDSWTFKLYYKASCAICMLGATVGVASQYFGDPIRSVLVCSLSDLITIERQFFGLKSLILSQI